MYHTYLQAEPFTFPGDKVACLLIHGFTASPSEVRPLGEYLNRQGYTVRAPLLPGHGTSPEHLNQKTWRDWYDTVEQEAKSLLDQGYTLTIIGLSMGALLALYLGTRIKDPRLTGIVAINTPLILKGWLASLAPIVQVFQNYIPKQIGDTDWELEVKGRFAYECIPVRAFASLKKLQKIVLTSINDIGVPVLLVQSLQDEVVDPQSVLILKNRIKSMEAEIFSLRESRHIATMGKELDILGYRIIEFIERNLVLEELYES